MYDNDEILENMPEYAFDLLDAAQRLLHRIDSISTTDFANGVHESEREALRKVVEQITGTRELTPRLSSEQYAARRGDYCPQCLSTSLSGDDVPRPDRGIIERIVRCRSCAVHLRKNKKRLYAAFLFSPSLFCVNQSYETLSPQTHSEAPFLHNRRKNVECI